MNKPKHIAIRTTPNSASHHASYAMVPGGTPSGPKVGSSGKIGGDAELLRVLTVLKPGRTLAEYRQMIARGVDVALVTRAKGA
ncbi:MAG: hypothetical protein SFX73_31850 [Kofleriaceae bacterium]|nr:hypothetical protein [Kofleriaceae bacterium]